jgi:predicted NUDIX family NTP pyrophosphohydrolase
MNRSAGLLLYHTTPGDLAMNFEVLLGHMGGPLWARKDDRAWSIPKGLVNADDCDEWATAQREFSEEMGQQIPAGPTIDLGIFRQNRGKEIHIWALKGDLDTALCSSGDFEMEWPPKSGRVQAFPEIDRAAWFDLDVAQNKVVAGQRQVLDALAKHLN